VPLGKRRLIDLKTKTQKEVTFAEHDFSMSPSSVRCLVYARKGNVVLLRIFTCLALGLCMSLLGLPFQIGITCQMSGWRRPSFSLSEMQHTGVPAFQISITSSIIHLLVRILTVRPLINVIKIISRLMLR
jgi:hypothetical protein